MQNNCKIKTLLLDNEYAKIELEEGIVIAKWKSLSVDLALAQLAVKCRLESTKNVSYPLLSDIKLVRSSTKEAREFLASEKGCKGIVVLPVLIDSPISRMIGNFFINFSKPVVPTKLFTDENEAKKWLVKYRV